ncbi:hypothetical protein QUA54_33515, partial [Microcoleus sp. MOSTC5]|uniref:hypothetical protein n=1 Tax=Microcoleus sp. MOSTC5 TaxID=3055378 RepID=UPI002FD3B5AB
KLHRQIFLTGLHTAVIVPHLSEKGYKNNLLDEVLWKGWSNYLRIKLEYPGVAKYWETNGSFTVRIFGNM